MDKFAQGMGYLAIVILGVVLFLLLIFSIVQVIDVIDTCGFDFFLARNSAPISCTISNAPGSD